MQRFDGDTEFEDAPVRFKAHCTLVICAVVVGLALIAKGMGF